MRIALVTPGGVDETGTDRVIPAFLWLVERLTTGPVPASWAIDVAS